MNDTPRPSASEDVAAIRSFGGSGLSVTFLAGATVIVATTAMVAALAGAGRRLDPAHAFELRRLFDVVPALCAIAVFALCRARWYQVRENTAVLAGTAALAVGLAAA